MNRWYKIALVGVLVLQSPLMGMNWWNKKDNSQKANWCFGLAGTCFTGLAITTAYKNRTSLASNFALLKESLAQTNFSSLTHQWNQQITQVFKQASQPKVAVGAGAVIVGGCAALYLKKCWQTYQEKKRMQEHNNAELARCGQEEIVLKEANNDRVVLDAVYYAWGNPAYPATIEMSIFSHDKIKQQQLSYSMAGKRCEETASNVDNTLTVRCHNDKIAVFKGTEEVNVLCATKNIKHVSLGLKPAPNRVLVNTGTKASRYRLAHVEASNNTQVHVSECKESRQNGLIFFDEIALSSDKPITQIYLRNNQLFVLCNDEVQIWKLNSIPRLFNQTYVEWVKDKSVSIQNDPKAMEVQGDRIFVFYDNKITSARTTDAEDAILYDNVSVVVDSVNVINETSIVATDKVGNLIFLSPNKRILLKNRTNKRPIKQCKLISQGQFGSVVIAVLDDNSIVMINVPKEWHEGIIFDLPEYKATQEQEEAPLANKRAEILAKPTIQVIHEGNGVSVSTTNNDTIEKLIDWTFTGESIIFYFHGQKRELSSVEDKKLYQKHFAVNPTVLNLPDMPSGHLCPSGVPIVTECRIEIPAGDNCLVDWILPFDDHKQFLLGTDKGVWHVVQEKEKLCVKELPLISEKCDKNKIALLRSFKQDHYGSLHDCWLVAHVDTNNANKCLLTDLDQSQCLDYIELDKGIIEKVSFFYHVGYEEGIRLLLETENSKYCYQKCNSKPFGTYLTENYSYKCNWVKDSGSHPQDDHKLAITSDGHVTYTSNNKPYLLKKLELGDRKALEIKTSSIIDKDKKAKMFGAVLLNDNSVLLLEIPNSLDQAIHFLAEFTPVDQKFGVAKSHEVIA